MAAYNAEAFIGSTLQSALGQSFEDFELIVVDDGSSDRTADVILGLGDRRIRLLSQEHRGPSAARNLGIRQAQAPVVVLLDHDDLWFAERLEKLLDHLRTHPQTSLVSSNMYVGDPAAPARATTVLDNPDCVGLALSDPRAWARHCSFSSSTAAIRRKVFEHHGLFDESLLYAQDWDLTLRFWLGGEKPWMISEPLGWTVSRPGQLSGDAWGMMCDRERVLRKALMRPALPPGFREAARDSLRSVKRGKAQYRLNEALAAAPHDPAYARREALWALCHGLPGKRQKLRAAACVGWPRVAATYRR